MIENLPKDTNPSNCWHRCINARKAQTDDVKINPAFCSLCLQVVILCLQLNTVLIQTGVIYLVGCVAIDFDTLLFSNCHYYCICFHFQVKAFNCQILWKQI